MRDALPFFSIIIPTNNRPTQLDVCLESLARLDYPRDRFEVIVVDDGSRNPLEAVIAPFRSQLDVTLLSEPQAGPATARNTGAARAKGEFLAFIDDDCLAAPDWLRALVARLVEAPDRIVGGRTANALPNNQYSTASQLLVSYLYTYYDANFNQARFFASDNLALPTDRFQAIGGFDPSFPFAAAEDRDLCDRWLLRGYRMTYAPEALVHHTHPLTLCTFWRQHFNYGRGAFHFHKLHAQRTGQHIRIEPLSFYLNLLCYPLSHARDRRTILLAALLMLSQVANAAGFWWEAGLER
ncbi:MAG TPA: glycosyltransferase [Anaerolineales bacterium]|nr:glycosyltransferase [Anaerolineales bacterium]